MERWIITEINGKIASISKDYGFFAAYAAKIAAQDPSLTETVSTRKISREQLIELSRTIQWEDLGLIGTPFQMQCWETLFRVTHTPGQAPKLLSYTEFAALCGSPTAVRAAAHAIAINPVTFVIPCHLVVPKESIDKSGEIRLQAQTTTLFKGADLYLLDTIDVGEYAWGSDLKREFIKASLR